MSKKKDILDAALKLFTENGARATSTKSIASEAETSEALIFKHFGSKEKLLEEIIKQGYQEATKIISDYINNEKGLQYILKIVEVPRILVDAHPDFWKMQHKIIALNWLSQKHHDIFMKPCYEKLTVAFSKLNYENPVLEAELLLIYIDGMWKHFASQQLDSKTESALTKLVQQKYKDVISAK
ncbi:TetR/AcrR family transcriptional regulator [Flavobacterium sp. ZS1P14]|uniref:TetR/AcrR family transcriptional regulator n=1 Tax=Flavobacterium sp. ZS1P14 TaxID=3401729 RepID=UPI003AAED12E